MPPPDLAPASWRGVPFAVSGQEHRTGRRTAVHEYPYRDEVWVEDLGRALRARRVNGFLVGDDVDAQRAAMRAAAETPGAGELVLPTEGRAECCLVGYSDSESFEQLRVVRLQFDFVQTADLRGLELLPDVVVDGRGRVLDAADAADAASAATWRARFAPGGVTPYGALQAAGRAVDAYVGAAKRLVGDATRVTNSVNALLGRFGRYSIGRIDKLLAPVNKAIRTVEGVRDGVRGVARDAARTRTDVERAATDVTRLGGLL